MRYRTIQTPQTGRFALIEGDDGELQTTWLTGKEPWLKSATRDNRLLPDLASRVVAYFDGEEVDFSDVPTPGGPEFFARCWEACRRIPRGSTISYATLAKRARSSPGASRAAGQAMRRNPLPVIIPCHRVIGADGGLNGFGGSNSPKGRELGIKQALLEMEGALLLQS